jgi:4-amino-4-deoxy-L-arabinose transferase-like glycosyltransferase
VLLWALLVFALGLGWGLPSGQGWAGDEIHPSDVERGAAQGFTDGWHFKYPPLHYRLLALLHRPLDALTDAGVLPSESLAATTVRFYAGRLLSVAMSLGTVLAVFLLTRRLFDVRAALFAAFAAASIPTLVYFAKTANPVAPFIFWAALSLVCFDRVLTHHRLRDYLLLALTAAAAVCTKDEAYALYLLAPLPIFASLAARGTAPRESGWPRRLGRSLLDPRPWAALAAFGLAFTLFHGLPGNLEGFRAHLQILTSPSLEEARAFAPTLSGQAALLARAARQWVFCVSPLLALAAAGGVALTLSESFGPRRDERTFRRWSLLLLAVSAYAGFVAVLLISRPRYLLPQALIATPFAGAALAALTAARGPAVAGRRLAAAALVAVSALGALSVDLSMLADSRYAAESFIAEHREPGERAFAVGRRRHVPRLPTLRWPKVIRTEGAALERAGAAFVVLNLSDLRGPREHRLAERLLAGELGYETVLRGRGEPLFDLLDPTTAERLSSGLRFVNPELAVLARHDVAARLRAEPALAAP